MKTNSREFRTARMIEEVADDIAYGATFGKIDAGTLINKEIEFCEAWDIATLICGSEEARLNVRDKLQERIRELAADYFENEGSDLIRAKLDEEDEEHAERLADQQREDSRDDGTETPLAEIYSSVRTRGW